MQHTLETHLKANPTTTDLKRVTQWEPFRLRRSHPDEAETACLLGGDLFPFDWYPPEPLALLAQALADPQARILRATPGNQFDPQADVSETIRALPLEKAAEEPHLHVTLFNLTRLCEPGCVLHPLREEVFIPFQTLWQAHGVRWSGDFWPILFISGHAAATNYHIDPTPNGVFHLFGKKQFHSLKRPSVWCPQPVKDAYLKEGQMATRPSGITDEDCLVHHNKPGDLVWVPQLTPHWVNAGSLSATITFAFRDFELLQGIRAEVEVPVETHSW